MSKKSKSLASKLNNRIEIWGKKEIESKIGDSYDKVLLKKIWADVIPTGGSMINGQANTDYNDTNFKIKIRKTDISSDNWIMFKGQRYDIKYFLPDFNDNKFIEIFAVLKTE